MFLHVISSRVASCHACHGCCIGTSSRDSSCRVFSCLDHVPSCHVMLCHVEARRVASCCVMSSLLVSCSVASCLGTGPLTSCLWCDISCIPFCRLFLRCGMSCRLISCHASPLYYSHVMFCCLFLCHVTSRHVTMCCIWSSEVSVLVSFFSTGDA